jgi:hypothetical protein
MNLPLPVQLWIRVRTTGAASPLDPEVLKSCHTMCASFGDLLEQTKSSGAD